MGGTGGKISAKKENNQYVIEANYDDQNQELKTVEKIIFTNKSEDTIETIKLHLYANAYKELETTPAIGKAKTNYPSGFNSGYIDIIEVMVAGESIEYRVENMVLTLLLNEELKSKETIDLEIKFVLKLPVATTRMSHLNGIAQFTNWYPILAVYEDGWQVREYYKIGESNYSEVADYDVTITLDKEQVVAATGNISEEILSENGKKVQFIAENVRDFAWVCSKDFLVQESIYNGVKIKSFYRSEHQEQGMETIVYAEKMLAFFQDAIGEYPYETFSIVETYLTGGGMEYPQLVTLGQNHYKDSYKLEHVIIHEGAHQWWYVTVGNDEHTYPWMDEGFATYYTDQYFHDLPWIAPKDIPAMAINSPVTAYTSWSPYNKMAYKMGAGVLAELQGIIGEEMFSKVMQTYYRKYRFKNANPNDFHKIIEEIAGKEVAESIQILYNR